MTPTSSTEYVNCTRAEQIIACAELMVGNKDQLPPQVIICAELVLQNQGQLSAGRDRIDAIKTLLQQVAQESHWPLVAVVIWSMASQPRNEWERQPNRRKQDRSRFNS